MPHSENSQAGHVSVSIERQRMKENRTPNYGLDAPVAVRNMLIVSALGIILLITRLALPAAYRGRWSAPVKLPIGAARLALM